jgi:hypothetical protein
MNAPKDHRPENRVIGSADVGDRIRSRGSTRLEFTAGRNLVYFIRAFFPSALAPGLGLCTATCTSVPVVVAAVMPMFGISQEEKQYVRDT